MIYLGVSARLLVNVEALNMAESVGNVVRHKRAPIVVRLVRDGRVVGYALRYAPVISGQSIAHGYQELLARIAKGMKLPVCPLCERGVFVKHSSDAIIRRVAEEYGAPYAKRLLELVKQGYRPEEFERVVVENCVVEDVGGFLFPGATPVKRTSRFLAGYMVPSIEHHTAVGVEAQFHVRHDPLQVEGGGQAIYYVETGSALYTLALGLDMSGIGCLSMAVEPAVGDRARRIEAAVRALALLVSGMGWGAKKSRFLPSYEVESLVVTISSPLPYNPAPGHSRDYIAETVRDATAFLRAVEGVGDGFVKVVYYASKRAPVEKPGRVEGVEVVEKSSPADAVLEALSYVKRASEECG